MSDKRKWVPEIMYEEYEEESISSGLPFIQVPSDKEMPDTLFVFCSNETGEFEPDLEGNPVPIMELELYQYANMKYLQDGLSPDDFDKVRVALGLLPLDEARAKGREKTNEMAATIKNSRSK
tara:strand:+ start:271 stop:636 length:366 start_codon:yes stop_codon:yes gene_type:complete